MSTLYLTHPACLDHVTPEGHPERSDRLRVVTQVLAEERFAPLVRGEADALSMPWSILRITGAQLLADRQINLLLQTGAEKDPGLPDLPEDNPLYDFFKQFRMLEEYAALAREAEPHVSQ